MNEPSNRRRGISVATLATQIQELPNAKRHLYFYIFLILIAILGDTIKHWREAPRPDAIPSINDTRAP